MAAFHSRGRSLAAATVAAWLLVVPAASAANGDSERILDRPIVDVAVIERGGNLWPDLLTLAADGDVRVTLLRHDIAWSIVGETTLDLSSPPDFMPWLVDLGDGRFAVVSVVGQGGSVVVPLRLDPSSPANPLRVGATVVIENMVRGTGAADVDGDGANELVVASPGPATSQVLPDVPPDELEGAFSRLQNAELSQQPLLAWSGDVDGDGCPEILAPLVRAGCLGTGDVQPGPLWLDTRPLVIIGPPDDRRLLAAVGLVWFPSSMSPRIYPAPAAAGAPGACSVRRCRSPSRRARCRRVPTSWPLRSPARWSTPSSPRTGRSISRDRPGPGFSCAPRGWHPRTSLPRQMESRPAAGSCGRTGASPSSPG